jgi:hypothetical protein
MADDKTPSPSGGRGNQKPLPGQPVPPPADDVLPGFPDARRVKSKTKYGGGLRPRWEGPDGTIYEWDFQHGRVEKYSHRGRHLGEHDPVTGQRTKPPNPDYHVEP